MPREELKAALWRSRAEELDALHRSHRPARRRSLLLGWLRAWLSRQAPAAVAPLPAVEPGEVAITWGGHATVLLRWSSLAAVVDPMLGGHIGVVPRAVRPGLAPGDLGDVGLVLITHPHPDHLHLPTLRRLPTAATVVVPPRTAALVSPFCGFARVIELGVGQSLSHRRVEVTAVPVRHPVSLGRTACAYVLAGEGPTIFVCGDSGYFSGFSEVGERHRPDIALLPIGGYVPRALRSGHMSPADALFAFEDLGARMMIPIHHGTFALSYEALDEPLSWLNRLVAERGLEEYVTVLAAGESRKFRRPQATATPTPTATPTGSIT